MSVTPILYFTNKSYARLSQALMKMCLDLERILWFMQKINPINLYQYTNGLETRVY